MTAKLDVAEPPFSYTRADFTSDQVVRWCPGCGDYSILAQMQRIMPGICEKARIPRERVVFVSGIGCSSRFPYYMNTYGFHGIHGRAPTLAITASCTSVAAIGLTPNGSGGGSLSIRGLTAAVV